MCGWEVRDVVCLSVLMKWESELTYRCKSGEWGVWQVCMSQ